MAFDAIPFFSDSNLELELVQSELALSSGICEVISVDSCDELPYVFEVSTNQKLSFSLSASHEVDLVLCSENAYDEWVDEGLQSEHPSDCILVLRHGCQHSMEFRPDEPTTLVAIIINLSEQPVQSVVAAQLSSDAARGH